MKKNHFFLVLTLMMLAFLSCTKSKEADTKIIFLHHSTGEVIWNGSSTPSLLSRAAGKISGRLGNALRTKPELQVLFENYNKQNGKHYEIKEMTFPKATPYGWNNYPYDYYNIWVKNAGDKPYMEEPTLEMLTKEYQVIIFKHCFPVSNIMEDDDSPDIESDKQTLANYKLQYLALRDKLHSYPDTKFILFTGAALTEATVTEAEAERTRAFFEWVKDEWDQPDDNIYMWDLYELETEGGLYLLDKYAVSPTDPHPNTQFAGKVVKLLFSRIIEVIENSGAGI